MKPLIFQSVNYSGKGKIDNYLPIKFFEDLIHIETNYELFEEEFGNRYALVCILSSKSAGFYFKDKSKLKNVMQKIIKKCDELDKWKRILIMPKMLPDDSMKPVFG